MFALVALMCLYLGINNIRNAFRLAAEGGWRKISVMLLVTGVLLLALAIPCVLQANKDLKDAKKRAEEAMRAEEEKKRLAHDQFFYDDEEGYAASGDDREGMETDALSE